MTLSLSDFIKHCEEVEANLGKPNSYLTQHDFNRDIERYIDLHQKLLKMLKVAIDGWELMASSEGWDAPGGRQGTAQKVLRQLEAIMEEDK